MTETPWLKAIFDSYNSKATNIFVLYGNTTDIFLGEKSEKSLKDYIEEKGGTREVVIHADPASGITIQKGGEFLEGFTSGYNPQEDIMEAVHRMLLFLANISEYHSTTVFITNPGYLVGKQNDARGPLLLERWSEDPHFRKEHPFIVLVADSMQELHPVVQSNQRIEKIEIPFPSEDDVREFLGRRRTDFAPAFSEVKDDLNRLAAAMTGTSLQNLDSLVKKQSYLNKPLRFEDLEAIKQRLVQQESRGLIEFLAPKNSLNDLVGAHNQAICEQFEGDMALWNEGKIDLIPNGVLLVGPPGTGKTFFVRCLAGTAARHGIPVIQLNNFREEWQGSTEKNLELIFRLTRSLARLYIFVDEADQALGSRSQGSGDSGVSSRIYAMFAKEMSNLDNKGRICWLLATSHPQLLEPDLKRPGRIDIKIPLLPCEDAATGAALLKSMAARKGLAVVGELRNIPELLTPGAANAIAEEVTRRKATGKAAENDTSTLNLVLESYQPPDPATMWELTQMAIAESSSADFVPKSFRSPASAVPSDGNN